MTPTRVSSTIPNRRSAVLKKWVSGVQTELPKRAPWPGALFALFLMAFGLSWLNPADQFSLTANYELLRAIAPEIFWGIFTTGYSAVWLVAIFTMPHKQRIILTIIGGMILLFISVAIYVGNPVATWALPTFTIGCGAMYYAGRMLALWTQQ